MITKAENNDLKKVLPAYYTDEVLEILNNKGIRNEHGLPYSKGYVRMVFQGVRTNKDIEAAIWTLATTYANEARKRKRKLDKLKNEV